MQRDLAGTRQGNAVVAARTNLTGFAAATAVLVLALAWYWPTAASIAAIWSRSETFTHGYAVLPIVGYLIWTRRAELAGVPLRPYPVALVGLALAGFGWLAGEMAGILGLTHFMLVAMVPLAVWAICGTEATRRMQFPLLFLFFAVPFGEAMVPYLMEWTADFTVHALRLTGVPVFREGNHFAIPSGRWSVIEACSGVRYMIASIMVGALFAHLNFRSLRRKLLFLGAAILVPLVANWIRAYLIVIIGHLSNNKYGIGADHIVFGWLFYGVVILLLFWIASRWRDLDAGDRGSRDNVAATTVGANTISIVMVAVAVLGMIAVWRPIATVLGSRDPGGPIDLQAIAADGAWKPAPDTIPAWTPHWENPTASAAKFFEKDGGHVGVHIAFYRNQTQGREVVNANNRIALDGRKFAVADLGFREIRVGNTIVRARASQVRGPAGRLAVLQWYWIGGVLTANDYLAKTLLLKSRLTMNRDDSAAILVFAEANEDMAAAELLLSRFAAEAGGGLIRGLEQASAR